MSEPGIVVRGFRPGRKVLRDTGDQSETVRLSNLERYILRARAGLPIFEEATSLNVGSLRHLFMSRRT